jgi:hypothetical protein
LFSRTVILAVSANRVLRALRVAAGFAFDLRAGLALLRGFVFVYCIKMLVLETPSISTDDLMGDEPLRALRVRGGDRIGPREQGKRAMDALVILSHRRPRRRSGRYRLPRRPHPRREARPRRPGTSCRAALLVREYELEMAALGQPVGR